MILVIEQLLNGLQYGVMLFLMAAGLTLIFGIMGVINLAHGALYMVGAFVGTWVATETGSFWLGLPAALVAAMVTGVVVEALVVRRLYARDHLDQVLATFALILIFNQLVVLIFGRQPVFTPMPELFSGSLEILPGLFYPMYRLLIIATGLVVAIGLYLLINRTRVGMLVRAGATNLDMVRALGVDIIDVRLQSTDLPQQNLAATFERMRAEREREATDERARGQEAAQRIRAQADRTVVELVSDAQREAEIARGEADAERNSIFAEAFGRDEDFFEFYRSLTAYARALKGGNSSMVLSPDSEFFKFLKSAEGAPAPAPAPTTGAASN